jgi:formaldehyde-activating enzyme involved in methanogenesis
MTDRPSKEQQLAAIIARALDSGPIASRPAATAIIAAVNDGTCDPIVPEGRPDDEVINAMAKLDRRCNDRSAVHSMFAALRAAGFDIYKNEATDD